MLRRAEWMDMLDFEYDSSFPDTDPYEPQPGGCCSIWPYFIGHLVELPLTMPQDHTLYEILGHADLSVWHDKADWIIGEGGLVVINLHPDYNTDPGRLGCYERFLRFMAERRDMWHARPADVARWWRARADLRLTRGESGYVLEGAAPFPAGVIFSVSEKGTLTDRRIRVQCGSADRTDRVRPQNVTAQA